MNIEGVKPVRNAIAQVSGIAPPEARWRFFSVPKAALQYLLTIATLHCSMAFAETPEQWLMEMSANSSRLSYSGSLVYAEGKRMQAMKIYHALKDGERRERLVHMSGQPREFIRRGDTVMCIDSTNGLVKLGEQGAGFGGDKYNGNSPESYSSNYAARFAALREPYQVSFDGHGRVAGREVTLIALRPNDDYRYGFSLALDTETKLLLRSLMLNGSGKVLERFEYTQIDIGSEIPMVDLEPQLKIVTPPAGAALEQAERSKPPPTSSAWRVEWVPAAFTLSHARPRKSAGEASVPGNQSRRMYSDGLTAFSVFVEENNDLGVRSWRRGATTAHTVVKRDALGLFSVTVVGELPLLAAQKIAASVSRAAGEGNQRQ